MPRDHLTKGFIEQKANDLKLFPMESGFALLYNLAFLYLTLRVNLIL
jgi:hypothetical protein